MKRRYHMRLVAGFRSSWFGMLALVRPAEREHQEQQW